MYAVDLPRVDPAQQSGLRLVDLGGEQSFFISGLYIALLRPKPIQTFKQNLKTSSSCSFVTLESKLIPRGFAIVVRILHRRALALARDHVKNDIGKKRPSLFDPSDHMLLLKANCRRSPTVNRP